MSAITEIAITTARPDAASLLGVEARKSSSLIAQIEQGLPFSAFDKMVKTTGLTPEQVRAAVRISERTLARRRSKAANRLTSEESDRLVRVSGVFALAVGLFEGERDAARQWFLSPNRAFAGKSPFEMVRTELGAREVENLVGRLEHGVFG